MELMQSNTINIGQTRLGQRVKPKRMKISPDKIEPRCHHILRSFKLSNTIDSCGSSSIASTFSSVFITGPDEEVECRGLSCTGTETTGVAARGAGGAGGGAAKTRTTGLTQTGDAIPIGGVIIG